MFVETLERLQNTRDKEHLVMLVLMNDLIILYKEQVQYEEAEELLLQAVEGRRLKLGDTPTKNRIYQ